MFRVSQKDERWGDDNIGNTNVKMKTDGCLITDIAMIRSGFYPHHVYGQAFIQPGEFAKGLTYNSIGEIIWTQSDFKKYGMEFFWRQYTYFPSIHNKDLKAYCKNPDFGVAIQVQTRKGGVHWLALRGKSVFGWATNDPWTGERLWKTVGWNAPYVRVLGYVVFKKHERLEKMKADE